MPKGRSKPINLRRTGLVVAVGVGLICVGLTLFMLARRGGTSGGGASVGPISDVKRPADVARLGENLTSVGKATIQYVDRRDPSRVAGTIQWTALEPLPNNRATVSEPRASIFMKDGRTIVVASPKARLFTPPGSQQPESGFFEGGVLVALFSPRSDGSVNTAEDAPVMLFHAASLSFDIALGELSSGENFVVSTRNMEVRGRAFRVLFNQVAERIERLDIEKIELARVAPGVRGPDDEPRSSSADANATAKDKAPSLFNPDGTVAVAQNATVTLYQILAQGDVTLKQRGRSLKADTLSVWTRLIDNALPPGAIPSDDEPQRGLPGAPQTAERAKPPQPPAPPLVKGMPEATLAAPPVLCPITDDDITIAWTGPLQMIPLAAPPPELDKDFVFARFASPRSGQVSLADTALNFTGGSPSLDVAATRREVVLSGTAPADVRLSLGDRGSLSAAHTALNLAEGLVFVRGAGKLATAKGDPRTIEWTDQANFAFAKSDGRTTDRLDWANFSGKVSASQKDAKLEADGLLARFAAARGTGEPVLSEVRAQRAVASSGSRQSLQGDELLVRFGEPIGGDVSPESVQATGRVYGRSSDNHLYSDALLVELDREPTGEPAVRKAYADGNVSFERGREPDGQRPLVVNTDRLTVTMPEERIELVGPLTSVTSGGATVTGSQMAIEGSRRELFVHGPGLFTLRRKLDSGGFAPRPMLTSAWDSSMRVNDLGGIAELIGNARAVATPKNDEIDWLNSERLIIGFTPGAGNAPAGAPTVANRPDPVAMTLGAGTPDSGDRRLLRMEAIGASVEQGQGARASVESRQFALDRDASGAVTRTLRRHLYLEGDRILAGADQGTLNVPGVGRLLIDQREPERTEQEIAAPTRAGQDGLIDVSRGKTGTSLFDWTGSLMLNRSTNLLSISDSVRLIHRRGPTDPIITLQCQTINGELRDAAGASGDAGQDPMLRPAELRAAQAFGNVFVQSDDGKQMTAEQLAFDVDRQVLEASGGSESRVSFMDPTKSAPVLAQRLLWFLREGRVEVIQPSAVIIPR